VVAQQLSGWAGKIGNLRFVAVHWIIIVWGSFLIEKIGVLCYLFIFYSEQFRYEEIHVLTIL